MVWFFLFFFSLDGKETKGQGCIFFAKIGFHSAEEKELALLRQLFLFNATFLPISSRKKNEAGPSFSPRLRHRWVGGVERVAFASLGWLRLFGRESLLGLSLRDSSFFIWFYHRVLFGLAFKKELLMWMKKNSHKVASERSKAMAQPSRKRKPSRSDKRAKAKLIGPKQ